MGEAKMAAKEILKTHMNLEGKDAAEYIEKNLE